MSDAALLVSDLSKSYRIGATNRFRTLRSDVSSWVHSLGRRGGSSSTFWALNGVTFEQPGGQVLGLIGRNGAGKSTLLKILSRVTSPTKGYAELRGRVGSLLEVGTGFHPELTGRENVYLSGAVLGMSRREIGGRFDSIVAFAGVDQFLDTPVKHYSSGMQTRLGFAVAAHLEPEILIVDEALAVGDAEFQRKCLGRMATVASSGRTVVFVSHSMPAIQALCDRVIRLDGGRVVDDGIASGVIARYISSEASLAGGRSWSRGEAPGAGPFRLHRTYLRRDDEGDTSELTVRTPFTIGFDYWNLDHDVPLSFTIHLLNEEGIMVFDTAQILDPWRGRTFPPGLYRSECEIPGDLLNDGVYRAELIVTRAEATFVWSMDGLVIFRVHDDPATRTAWHERWQGVVRPLLRWTTHQLEETDLR